MWTNVPVCVGRMKPKISELLSKFSKHEELKESEDQGHVQWAALAQSLLRWNELNL